MKYEEPQIVAHFGLIGDVHGYLADYAMSAEVLRYSLQLGDLAFNYDGIKLDPNHHKFLPGNHDNYSVEEVTQIPEDAFLEEVTDVPEGTNLFEDGSRYTIKGDKVYRYNFNPRGRYTIIGEKVYRYTHLPPNFIGHFGTWKVPECKVEIPGRDELFFVRGAWSIDHARRTMGVDLFEREEMSQIELMQAIEAYKKAKPWLVVTHTAPLSIVGHLNLPFSGGKVYPTKTSQALERMLEIHQPEYWVFGHFHQDWSKKIGNTHFVCLDELSVMAFDEAMNPYYVG